MAFCAMLSEVGVAEGAGVLLGKGVGEGGGGSVGGGVLVRAAVGKTSSVGVGKGVGVPVNGRVQADAEPRMSSSTPSRAIRFMVASRQRAVLLAHRCALLSLWHKIGVCTCRTWRRPSISI